MALKNEAHALMKNMWQPLYTRERNAEEVYESRQHMAEAISENLPWKKSIELMAIKR